MAVSSYMLSFLAVRSATQPGQFSQQYAGPWLVWEPGDWRPAAGTSATLVSNTNKTPGVGDALCFQLAAAKQVSVGRDSGCDVVVNDATVSRHHVTLMATPFGFDLGAGTPGEVRATVRRLVGWALASGVVLGGVLAGVAPWLGYVFSSDAGVIAAVPVGAWVVAGTMPLGALVFVLDGVLIGAADGRYLALAGLVNLLVYVPLLWWAAQTPAEAGAPAAVLAIQLAKDLEKFGLYFLEDPFSPEDIGYFEKLRAQTSTPIAMGELFNNPNEWVGLVSKQLIDFIRIHVSQVGGLTMARKVAALRATKCDVVAAGNIGCMMQIRSAADAPPVVHTIELLDWATGGSPPPILTDHRSRETE